MLRPATVAVAIAALVVPTPAWAHVTVVPPFVAADSTARLSVTGPNEREEPMTAFEVSVTSDFVIVRALPAGDWDSRVRGGKAIWTGGSLAEGDQVEFDVTRGPKGLQAANVRKS